MSTTQSANFDDDINIRKATSSGGVIYSQTYGTTAFEHPTSVALTSSGDLIVVGYYIGDPNVGTGAVSASFGNKDIFMVKYSGSTGLALWAKFFGSTGDDLARSVAIDGDNNIVMTGSFRNTISFEGTDLTSSSGASDIFVAKFDANGNATFAKNYNSSLSSTAISVGIDKRNNCDGANGSDCIFIVGAFSGSVDFGTGNHTSGGSTDAFVVKINSSGQTIWANSYGNTNADAANSVAIDSLGNVVIGGVFYRVVDFGGQTRDGGTSGDGFVLKLSSNNALSWVKSFGGSSFDTVQSVTLDGSNQVYATGYFSQSFGFDGNTVTSNGSTDVFVLSYTEIGTEAWAYSYGGTGVDVANSITTRSSTIGVLGYFSNSAQFGTNSLSSSGTSDAFLLKY